MFTNNEKTLITITQEYINAVSVAEMLICTGSASTSNAEERWKFIVALFGFFTEEYDKRCILYSGYQNCKRVIIDIALNSSANFFYRHSAIVFWVYIVKLYQNGKCDSSDLSFIQEMRVDKEKAISAMFWGSFFSNGNLIN